MKDEPTGALMRQLIAIVLAAIISTSCASAQAPTTQSASSTEPAAAASAKPLSADSSVDDILDALDARGKDLSDFTADVTLDDANAANGNNSTLSGKMWMQRLPGDDARLRVTFDHKSVNGKPPTPDKSEYTLAS